MRINLYILSLLLLLSSCTNDKHSVQTIATAHNCKVAVIMEQDEQDRWERTAKWAVQNITQAQYGLNHTVQLQLVFKSQDDEDFEEFMQQAAQDPSIEAIVGPTTSACAEQMALELGKRKAYNKPMITPSATRVEYQRKFAGVPYIWNMAESDIAQLEVLLSGIASTTDNGQKSIMLLTADDSDGESRNAYAEWFGFIAEEYGLNVEGVYLYKDESGLREYVHEFCGTDWHLGDKYLVFNPSGAESALALDDEIGRIKGTVPEGQYFYSPSFVCSDAFVSERIASAIRNTDYEGVDLYASPESGFNQAYQQQFGQELVNGEAQFYDALCIVAYAKVLSINTGISLNDAILSVVDGRNGKGSAWLPTDMARNFSLISQGETPDIDGVSGSWTFDDKTHSSVCSSTFRRWRLYNGKFLTTEYISTDGSRRTSSSKHLWDWTSSRMQAFSANEGNNLNYPPLNDRWALLIAASKGWANYRFQADVFAMYQLLRQHGYPEDHIVLICQDDVARHKNNPYQNALYVSESGMNVYNQSAIDYHLDQLTPNDINDILQGKESERLPHVLRPTANDNVFIFWTSHGSPGSLEFGGAQTMTYRKMKEILEGTPHRKLLFALEACYSGGLGEYCQGLHGALFITAATPYESSHADVWSELMGVYLSNGFTRGFQEAINSNPAVSIRDLYYSLATNIAGSHVKVYNASHYGSVYNNSMSEFLLIPPESQRNRLRPGQ
ncbi:MAG: hypothetical protein J6V95_01605 [Bacteroidaceae bacterium]|nr:hypothetical protein [Bacteroidaceae bacterium]